MKLTNILLIMLIGLVAFQKIPEKKEKTVSKNEGIKIKRVYKKTKSIKPTVLNKEKTKHSTTLRNYISTDNRRTTSLNHSIRIDNDYYISGGIYNRQSSYGGNDTGVNFSITRYW